MKRKLLVAAIASALVLPLIATTAMAQQTGPTSPTKAKAKKAKVQKLKKIIVTGSLIPQAEIETASPTITLTPGDIQRQGFTSVYQALRAQPLATGAVQGQQFTAGFTTGASTISLLGLNPGFTLFLIDGKPMADFPLLYNGQSNFVDISNIPLGMIDHIDIVPGNQSSIYGSSAIAGVVNIILKQRTEGITLDYRAGSYADGGGNSQRVQLTGGYNTDRLNLVYGLQYNSQQPIWGFQRALTKSSNSNPNPNGRYSPRNFLVMRYGQPDYLNPTTLNGATPCAAISNQYGGTLGYQNRPGHGYYCGSKQSGGFSTLMNRDRTGSAYLHANYRLNSNAQLYGMLLYTVSSKTFYAGPFYNWWGPDLSHGNYIINANTGSFDYIQTSFAPEETGGLAAGSTLQITRAYSIFGGVRGNLGNSNWAYDAYYARSQNKLYSAQRHPLTAKVNAFFESQFLGSQLGTYYGYKVYAPDYSKFYQNFTPADYQGFTGVIHNRSETYTQNVNLQVTNTSLFELPAGPVGFAGVLQAGDSYWSLPIDPRLIAGDFWGETGSSGAGKRNNYAVATEFRVPIFSQLTANVSARYDKYKNVGGSSDSDTTYKIGLEYRPTDTLLFRANYATAFRAPDLGYAFIGPSGFYSFTTDYYRCELLYPNTPIDQCRYNSVQFKGTQLGNPNLKSITAKSWGAGIVWSPSQHFDLKADFYSIRIANEVTYQSVSLLMKQEAACLLGQLPSTSATCQAALSQVQRGSATGPVPYNLLGITVHPMNVSHEAVRGVVSSVNYRWSMGKYGDFSAGLRYNVTLQHTYQQYAGDPTIRLLHTPYYSSEFKTILTGSLAWQVGNWTTTLYGIRYGKTPNYAAQISTKGYAATHGGAVRPWILYNGSVQYNVTDNAKVSLYVNNLFDAMPPADNTWTGYPYYNGFNYNVFGRSYWVEFNVRFGAGS